jgi:hypothetical protein
MESSQTPAAEISEVVNGWQWDAAAGQWVQATPPPPAPPQPAGTVEPAAGGTATPPPPPPPEPEGELPPPPPAAQTQTVAEPKVMDAEWPCQGYAGPQPWEADNPPSLTQNHLMVSSGTAGEEVVELAALLAHLGYGTSISAGQNPHAIYDTGVSESVAAFCRDFGVAEDPQVRRARTEDTVGPWIWEALVRAVHKKIAEPGSGEESGTA